MNRKKPRIIWESRTAQIVAVCCCFLFAAVSLWAKDNQTGSESWGGFFFFCICGIALLVRLLDPRNIFVRPGSEQAKAIAQADNEERLSDPGHFSYTPGGYSQIQDDGSTVHHQWSEIETIFGYKEYFRSLDEICIDIFFQDHTSITYRESDPGWYILNETLKTQFPAIPTLWEIAITDPPLEANLTLLFDRHGRTAAEAEAWHYKTPARKQYWHG